MVKPVISVCFRVDADEQLGLGHLSRCRSLMLAFSLVAKCNFSVISNNKSVVRKFIPNIGYDLFDVNFPFAGQTFDIVIVDVPNIDQREDQRIRGLSDLVVCIDDDGPGLSGQDILIRCNLLDLPKPAGSGLSLKNYWSGRDYIILHPDFTTQANRKNRKKRSAAKLLVCFGGSDPAELTLRVIPLLKELEKNIAINLVLGPAFSGRKKVGSLIKNDPRFSVDLNVPNMSRHLWAADLALISGGTLLYEACSLGIPAVVLSQNEGQAVEAKICHSAGAIVSLGVNKAVADDKILLALQQLVKDSARREKMAGQGPKLVSPSGSLRIVSKLLSEAKGASRP